MATEVTNMNWIEAMDQICDLVQRYNHIAFDVEFPGFIHSTPREASDVERYADLKANVDALKPIQFGITFTDRMGRMPDPFLRCWQFTFEDFFPDLDVPSFMTAHFLCRKDFDFDKNDDSRVSPVIATTILNALLQRKRRDLTWITFHGLYDVAYLLKLVTPRRPLPDTLPEFADAVGKTLGNVYDTKIISESCLGWPSGLSRLANFLEVQLCAEALRVQLRGARPHYAGYDSLLTAGVFAKLRLLHPDGFDVFLARSRGLLYGLESVIIHPPPGILGCCCCLFR